MRKMDGCVRAVLEAEDGEEMEVCEDPGWRFAAVSAVEGGICKEGVPRVGKTSKVGRRER